MRGVWRRDGDRAELGMSYRTVIVGLWIAKGHREARYRKERGHKRYMSPSGSGADSITELIRLRIGTKQRKLARAWLFPVAHTAHPRSKFCKCCHLSPGHWDIRCHGAMSGNQSSHQENSKKCIPLGVCSECPSQPLRAKK